MYSSMQLKTSRIAFAIEDADGAQRQSEPRVVVTLTTGETTVGRQSEGQPLQQVRHAVQETLEELGLDAMNEAALAAALSAIASAGPEPMQSSEPKPSGPRLRLPFIRSLADEQVHIVPCKDCVRLLWVDRAAGVLESVVISPGAFNEALRGLLSWCKQTEDSWSRRAD